MYIYILHTFKTYDKFSPFSKLTRQTDDHCCVHVRADEEHGVLLIRILKSRSINLCDHFTVYCYIIAAILMHYSYIGVVILYTAQNN